VKNNLKAPDSAEFQEERKDFVEWKDNVDCHHNQCSGSLFFVRTKAYAINSYNARLLHTFSCDVVCTNTGNCRVKRMWEEEWDQQCRRLPHGEHAEKNDGAMSPYRGVTA
jgi:hypothetical protein